MKKIITFLSLAILAGCCGKGVTFYAFCFPPNTLAHETNWTHIAWVYITDLDKKGEREVDVVVKDQLENILLEDKFVLALEKPRFEAIWTNLTSLQIQIYDSLSNKTPFALNYIMDGKSFKKKDVEQPSSP